MRRSGLPERFGNDLAKGLRMSTIESVGRASEPPLQGAKPIGVPTPPSYPRVSDEGDGRIRELRRSRRLMGQSDVHCKEQK